jgi:hypothetical protein
MKRIILFTALAFTLCSAFTLLNEPSKDIIGKWKIDESSITSTTLSIIAVTRKSNPELADQLDGQLDMVKDMVREMSFEYKADNSYEITTPQGPQFGKWAFSSDNKYLIINRVGKPERKDLVLEITSDRLKLVNPERADTTLYIRP